jgi:hypothetical protein
VTETKQRERERERARELTLVLRDLTPATRNKTINSKSTNLMSFIPHSQRQIDSYFETIQTRITFTRDAKKKKKMQTTNENRVKYLPFVVYEIAKRCATANFRTKVKID